MSESKYVNSNEPGILIDFLTGEVKEIPAPIVKEVNPKEFFITYKDGSVQKIKL